MGIVGQSHVIKEHSGEGCRKECTAACSLYGILRYTSDRIQAPDRNVAGTSSGLAYRICMSGVPGVDHWATDPGTPLEPHGGPIERWCSKMRQGTHLPVKERRLVFSPRRSQR